MVCTLWWFSLNIHARCIISCLKSSFLMHVILTKWKYTMSSFIAAQEGLCDYKIWWIAGCFQHKSCMALVVIWGYEASRAHVLCLNTWSAVRFWYFFSAILNNIIWPTKFFKIFESQINAEDISYSPCYVDKCFTKLSHLIANSVTADGLKLVGARTSACTMMTKCIYAKLALERLTRSEPMTCYKYHVISHCRLSPD